MKQRDRHTAYLVAVHQRREATRVYAVVALAQTEALSVVNSMKPERAQAEVVGALSRNIARSLDLKPGDVCLV